MTVQLLRRKFTVEQFHKMAESGILNEDDRVELIRGEIIEMAA
ncbi:MAG: Uma2 family endonuclease, partial [Cyanobacteria bacterium J06641_2]